jgi:hypothetical protein
VSRRLVPLVALVLVVAVGAGCADDVAPAARAGDSIVITNDELMTEAAEWAGSPALLKQVNDPAVEGAAPGSYSTDLIGVVLTYRLTFELHREQFDALGLSLSDADTATLASQLSAVTAQLSPAFANRLVEDLARVNAVSTAMGDSYNAWYRSATASGVEVSSRYGSWDGQAGGVKPPDGPLVPASADQLVGA